MLQMRQFLFVMTATLCSLFLLTACEEEKKDDKGAAQILQEKLMRPGPLPENILGNPDAKITLVEYASMSCPHCAEFHNKIFPELKKKYIDTGKVRFILREFPHNPYGMAAFMMARCVEPKNYFPLVEVLFAKQDQWLTENPIPKLLEISKHVGFTEDSIKKCLENKDLEKKISDVMSTASKEFDVHTIPTFFINGVRLGRDHSIEDFDKIIAEMSK